jgi:hypothetical protein
MLANKLLGASKAAVPVYIEDVFSTWLYTGNNSAQTITNGIDLSGKGGLVWIKNRTTNSTHGGAHQLVDTARGLTGASGSSMLSTNNTDPASGAQAGGTAGNQGFSSFSSSGFNLSSVGGSVYSGSTNTNAVSYTSWTFRKQPKFFDVVTYTGNGSNRTISHSLGSVPGCIIVKRTDTAADWQVYHRGLANTEYLVLNDTATKNTGATRWNSTTPTSTVFSLGTNTTVNANGGTYVAYLFAHDAGGFGAAGTDNVITCGSYTGNGGANTITLGYEPQWLLVKKTSVQDSTSFWSINDIMRGGLNARGNASQIKPNATEAEDDLGGVTTLPAAIATGFTIGNAGGYNASGETYIYIAIRRPMKTPTSGTQVYEGTTYTGNATAQRQIGSTVLMDMLLLSCRSADSLGWTSYAHFIFDRLRGGSNPNSLATSRADAEITGWFTYLDFDKNIGWDTSSTTAQDYLNKSGSTFVSNVFKRAPGFLDVVCYTGTGSNRTITHNLGVVPELMIVKVRSGTTNDWWVYDAATGNTKYQALNTTAAPVTSSTAWNNTTPTSSVFTVGTGAGVNGSTFPYVAYLFASISGVSKVGSYTGTGTTQTINCGFTAGARFVMIKRTDSTGDWYVWDTARGIVSGNDPYLLLNSTAAEVTNTDYIDPANSGFEISSTAPAAINANGGSFIFFAVA